MLEDSGPETTENPSSPAPEAVAPAEAPAAPAGASIEEAIRLATEAETPAEPAPEPVAEAAPPAPEPVPTPVPQDDRAAVAYQQLVEQERALQAERQRIAEERQQLEELSRYRSLHERATEKDVLGALVEMGFDPEEVADAIVEGRGAAPGKTKETALQKQIEELRAEFAKRDAAAAERDQAAQLQAARDEIRTQTSSSPLLAAVGDEAIEVVLETFRSHYDQTGATLTYPEAIQRVEAQFEELLRGWAKHDAVRKILSENAPPSAPAPATPPASPTLTNRTAATVTHRSTEPETPVFNGDRHALIEQILAAQASA